MTNDFTNHLPLLTAQYGATIRRSDLALYCSQQGIDLPKLPCVMGGRNPVYSLTDAPEATDATVEAPVELTDEEVEEQLRVRFNTLEDITRGVIDGHFRAVIISGNPGIGKTYTIEQMLTTAAEQGAVLNSTFGCNLRYTSVRGFTRATGLYRLLYENREAGDVLLFDDCDSVFGDETALNLLKAALDTTQKRTVSWYSEKPFKDEDGENLPKSFEFQGAVIFVTNVDFDRAMNTKLGPHLEALLSRSLYLDLNLRTEKALMARLAGVVRHSEMLAQIGLTAEQGETVLSYIREKRTALREISLRTIVKLGCIIKAAQTPDEFQRMAFLACCKA